MRNNKILFLLSLVCIAAPCLVGGASIVASKHDLSSTDSDKINEVCVFCHTPHNANPNLLPLWNRKTPDVTKFQMYTASTTMNVKPSGAAPSPVSLLCLSCHDGAGVGSAVTVSDTHNIINAPGDKHFYSAKCTSCHNFAQTPSQKRTIINIGPNLTNDHPISMPYPTNAQDPDFNTPTDPQKGWESIKLYDSKVECASCHNVHDPGVTPFLRTVNTGSKLCLKCHAK